MPHRLLGLQTGEYEHPFDKYALEKVTSIPVLPAVLNKIMTWTKIKWDIVALCGTNFHVTREACPDLFQIAHTASDILDLNKLPNLYIQQDYYINAYTTGFKDDAYMVLNSGTVDALTEEELSFVVGHEMGHIKSGHVLYHLTAAFLAQIASGIPGSSILQAPLDYWQRMSEFTADRAGLLACQNLDAALSSIMKMSGLPSKYYDKASVEGFMKQAKEFDEEYSGYADQIIKGVTILTEDHPWTILRASELIKWVESGDYEKIIDGTHKVKKCPICGFDCQENTRVCPRDGFVFDE